MTQYIIKAVVGTCLLLWATVSGRSLPLWLIPGIYWHTVTYCLEQQTFSHLFCLVTCFMETCATIFVMLFARFPLFLLFMASPIMMQVYIHFNYFGWILFYHFINCLMDERKQNFLHKNTFIFKNSMSTFYVSFTYPSVQYHHRIGTVTNTSVMFILLSWHVWKKCITLSNTLTWHSLGLHRQYFYNFVCIKSV